MLGNIDKAKVLFEQKFHCSQAVFASEFGIIEEQALKIGACFGAGMVISATKIAEQLMAKQ